MQPNGTLPELDIERIKAFNSNLKTYTEKGSKMRAELEFNTKELNKLCAELTAETGIQITIENLEQVYMDRVAKIENTLQVGEEIINRIYQEESGIVQPVNAPSQQAVGATGQIPGLPSQQTVGQVAAPAAGAPAAGAPAAPPAGAPQGIPGIPGMPNVPGMTGIPEMPAAPSGGDPAGQPNLGLPNMFGNKNTINI